MKDYPKPIPSAGMVGSNFGRTLPDSSATEHDSEAGSKKIRKNRHLQPPVRRGVRRSSVISCPAGGFKTVTGKIYLTTEFERWLLRYDR
jgi:hypothetical protein